jgi:hypothetical protein
MSRPASVVALAVWLGVGYGTGVGWGVVMAVLFGLPLFLVNWREQGRLARWEQYWADGCGEPGVIPNTDLRHPSVTRR